MEAFSLLHSKHGQNFACSIATMTYVPDWIGEPRILLGMVEARLVNVKKHSNNKNMSPHTEHATKHLIGLN